MQLSVHDAARILRVAEKQVYRWIEDGELPCYWVNEQARLNGAELLEWATSRRLQVSAELLPKPDTDSDTVPSLTDALTAGGIHYDVQGTDRAAVLQAVVDRLPLPDGFDRAMLVQILLAREAGGTTAVGDGMAIPHVRQPIAVNAGMATSCVTLCFLANPVDFGPSAGQRIHTLFTMVTPTIRSHLHLLAKLASALHDPDFKSAVLRRAPRDDLLTYLRRAEARSPQVGDPGVP